MHHRSDEKNESVTRLGGANQTTLKFFTKRPDSTAPNNIQAPGHEFAGANLHTTLNSSSLNSLSTRSQPHDSNPSAQASVSSLSSYCMTPKEPWTKSQAIFKPTAGHSRPNSTFNRTHTSAAAGTYSATSSDTNGLRNPPPRSGSLTDSSGSFQGTKRPTSSAGNMQQNRSTVPLLSAVKKHAAPWGAKNVESIGVPNPAHQSNPFREKTASFSKSEARISRSQLSPCQLRVVDAIFSRKSSVFFTGSAGTGKSFLLKYIIAELRGVQDEESGHRRKEVSPSASDDESLEHCELAVTATTGIAAFQLGGATVHSFAGIGLGRGKVETLLAKIRRNKRVAGQWKSLRHLIIDEVSMLDGDLFSKLDRIARSLRRSTEPFGGIQLILAGDFFQLPPVSRDEPAKFCFEADSWKECIPETIVLRQIFRQRDQEFCRILNEARLGRLSPEAIQIFRGLSRPVQYPNDGIEATELFSTRKEVADSNNRRLAMLGGEAIRIEARDSGSDPFALQALDSQTMLPKVIDLKVNAQVMLVKNLTRDPSLVNGSLGIVTGFSEVDSEEDYDEIEERGSKQDPAPPGRSHRRRSFRYPRVRFTSGIEILIYPEKAAIEKNDKVVARRLQIPLILAWAISIHKAQGQTLERLKVDLSRIFERGQAYVALSRATSLDSLQVLSFDPNKVNAHPKVAEFYRACTADSSSGTRDL